MLHFGKSKPIEKIGNKIAFTGVRTYLFDSWLITVHIPEFDRH